MYVFLGSFGLLLNHVQSKPEKIRFVSFFLLPPFLGHVGAMLGVCGTYVGPMLGHFLALGGYAGDMLSRC